MENPDKTWNNILAKEALKAPPEQTLFEVHPKSFVHKTFGVHFIEREVEGEEKISGIWARYKKSPQGDDEVTPKSWTGY